MIRLWAGHRENRGSIAGRGKKFALLSTASRSAVLPNGPIHWVTRSFGAPYASASIGSCVKFVCLFTYYCLM